jgi:hypothetical protein
MRKGKVRYGQWTPSMNICSKSRMPVNRQKANLLARKAKTLLCLGRRFDGASRGNQKARLYLRLLLPPHSSRESFTPQMRQHLLSLPPMSNLYQHRYLMVPNFIIHQFKHPHPSRMLHLAHQRKPLNRHNRHNRLRPYLLSLLLSDYRLLWARCLLLHLIHSQTLRT